MIRKVLVIGMGALVASLITGCASVVTAQKFNDQKLTLGGIPEVAHINGGNWGLYILNAPILTGSTAKPGDLTFGENTVNVESVVDMVTAKSKEMGGTKVVDLQSDRSCLWIAPFLVLFVKSVEVSGTSVK